MKAPPLHHRTSLSFCRLSSPHGLHRSGPINPFYLCRRRKTTPRKKKKLKRKTSFYFFLQCMGENRSTCHPDNPRVGIIFTTVPQFLLLCRLAALLPHLLLFLVGPPLPIAPIVTLLPFFSQHAASALLNITAPGLACCHTFSYTAAPHHRAEYVAIGQLHPSTPSLLPLRRFWTFMAQRVAAAVLNIGGLDFLHRP